jgi:hypothetical protein
MVNASVNRRRRQAASIELKGSSKRVHTPGPLSDAPIPRWNRRWNKKEFVVYSGERKQVGWS